MAADARARLMDNIAEAMQGVEARPQLTAS